MTDGGIEHPEDLELKRCSQCWELRFIVKEATICPDCETLNENDLLDVRDLDYNS